LAEAHWTRAQMITKAKVGYSVPMLHVRDVERSVKFYELLGFTATTVMRNDKGEAFWAAVACYRGNPEQRTDQNAAAEVFLTRGGDSVTGRDTSGVSLYMYSPDLPGLRERLLAAGVEVTEIVPRFYMEKGEMETHDPDGYLIFVGQV
jgi:catechol 2,3-dioxygenase-like lactoylglutathione lyase family enzyme